MSHDSYPCPTCGFVLQPQFRFCPSCGTPNQPPAPTVAPEAEQIAPSVDAETDGSASVASPLVMPEAEAGSEEEEAWQMPPMIEQVETQEETQISASEAPYVDFASLFGYGTEEAPAQSEEQIEQPALSVEAQAEEVEQAVIDEPPGAEEQPVVEESPAADQEQMLPLEASATAAEVAGAEEVSAQEPAQALASEDRLAITGPLPDASDLPTQPVELDENADAAPEIAEVEDSETGVSVDVESEHTPAAPYIEAPIVESGGGAATGPLEAAPAHEPTSTEPAYEPVEEEPANAEPAEQIAQPEPVYAVQSYEAIQPEPVEEQSAYAPAQQDPVAATEQPEVISFSELFAWQSADQTGDSAPLYTPPAEAAQEQQQEVDVSSAPTSEQAADDVANAEPEALAQESSATVYTFDYSTPQREDEEDEIDAPSWKPGDEPVAPAQPVSPVYRSYEQNAPPMPAPPPPTQPAMPPGERPKPGTPEYEEMARRAMEQKQGGTPATAPVDTSPLSTPSYTHPAPTPPYGYTPEPTPQPAPPPPVQPSMPPPGQRPRPGTPEYEEMARRAMEQHGSSSTNTSPLSTSPQPTQPIYSPEPPPQPVPPTQPSMPPPGQRPRPGTPEYEEMARRAMEERRRQQGQ